MKFLPRVDTESDAYGMDLKQDITVIILTYISIFLYSTMFGLEIYNMYKFLYKQGKYKIFPLTLFYTLATPVTVLRIMMNIWIVPDAMYDLLAFDVLPADFKICIGFSQILVMIEL